MERRRELLRTEVFTIVKNMLARGERSIQARVQNMLNADSLKAWKTLGRFLNEATGNRHDSFFQSNPGRNTASFLFRATGFPGDT